MEQLYSRRRRGMAVIILTAVVLIALVGGYLLKDSFSSSREISKFGQGPNGSGNGVIAEGHQDKEEGNSKGNTSGSKGNNNGQQEGKNNGNQSGNEGNSEENNGGTSHSGNESNGGKDQEPSQTENPGATNNGSEQNVGEGSNPNESNNGEGQGLPNIGSGKKPDEAGAGTGEKPDDQQSGSTGKGNVGNGGDQKVVALTFDDGPDAKYTPAILDTLKEKGVKATFFVVGTQVKKYPDMMKRIVDEGHALGNHSYDHKQLTKLNKTQILKQFEDTDQLIKDAVGFYPKAIRAPYGALNDTVRKVMKENDRYHVGWTVDTRDWAGTSVSDMRKLIKEETKNNGIILMHSFGGKHIQNTVDMIGDVIEDLKALGFTFVTTDELP